VLTSNKHSVYLTYRKQFASHKHEVGVMSNELWHVSYSNTSGVFIFLLFLLLQWYLL